MKKEYVLDLTDCNTFDEIIIAVKTDLNARKQLGYPKKKSLLRRIFGF